MSASVVVSKPTGRGTIDSPDREPVLDGIRGIAILLVLFHHAVIYSGAIRDNLLDKALLRVGNSTWLGVDLFFVLSGFLITGILYDARSSPRYFGSFYGRRILRIFPLYYGFLALAFLLAPLWLTAPDGAAAATKGQGWYWLYLSNVQVALWGWQEPLYLGHFWSLAIEEQFYLVWPFVVHRFDRRRLLTVTVVCFVSAFGLRVVAPFGLSVLGAHVLMPTRMDSLAAGACLALLIRGPAGWRAIREWSRTVGVACAIAAAGLFAWRRGFGEVDPVIGSVGLSVFAVGFAAAIGVALTSPSRSALRRILSATPLVALGQYSYGLYVFHQPLILGLRDLGLDATVVPRLWGSQAPGVLAFGVIAVALSTTCAVVSWHLWEQPFLRLKRYLPYQSPSVSRVQPLASPRTDSLPV
jgi:peptidoglycan/LPS O-acetylase OafA/YrhL